jgi:predicted  nucleic acid-binding Zn-ribbon protein
LPTGIDLNAVAKLKTELQQAEERVRQLESKLKDAEEDAHIKAQEVSSGVVNTDNS